MPRIGISTPGYTTSEVDSELDRLSDSELARYAAKLSAADLENNMVVDFQFLDSDVQFALRAKNAIARRARLATKEASAKTEAARRTALNQESLAEYERECKARYTGGAADWPGVWAQLRQARLVADIQAGLDAGLSEKRNSAIYQGT